MKTKLEYKSLTEVEIDGVHFEISQRVSWAKDVEKAARETRKSASQWDHYGIAKAILEMIRESERTGKCETLRRFVQPCRGKIMNAKVSRIFDHFIRDPYVEIVTYDPLEKRAECDHCYMTYFNY